MESVGRKLRARSQRLRGALDLEAVSRGLPSPKEISEFVAGAQQRARAAALANRFEAATMLRLYIGLKRRIGSSPHGWIHAPPGPAPPVEHPIDAGESEEGKDALSHLNRRAPWSVASDSEESLLSSPDDSKELSAQESPDSLEEGGGTSPRSSDPFSLSLSASPLLSMSLSTGSPASSKRPIDAGSSLFQSQDSLDATLSSPFQPPSCGLPPEGEEENGSPRGYPAVFSPTPSPGDRGAAMGTLDGETEPYPVSPRLGTDYPGPRAPEFSPAEGSEHDGALSSVDGGPSESSDSFVLFSPQQGEAEVGASALLSGGSGAAEDAESKPGNHGVDRESPGETEEKAASPSGDEGRSSEDAAPPKSPVRDAEDSETKRAEASEEETGRSPESGGVPQVDRGEPVEVVAAEEKTRHPSAEGIEGSEEASEGESSPAEEAMKSAFHEGSGEAEGGVSQGGESEEERSEGAVADGAEGKKERSVDSSGEEKPEAGVRASPGSSKTSDEEEESGSKLPLSPYESVEKRAVVEADDGNVEKPEGSGEAEGGVEKTRVPEEGEEGVERTSVPEEVGGDSEESEGGEKSSVLLEASEASEKPEDSGEQEGGSEASKSGKSEDSSEEEKGVSTLSAPDEAGEGLESPDSTESAKEGVEKPRIPEEAGDGVERPGDSVDEEEGEEKMTVSAQSVDGVEKVADSEGIERLIVPEEVGDGVEKPEGSREEGGGSKERSASGASEEGSETAVPEDDGEGVERHEGFDESEETREGLDESEETRVGLEKSGDDAQSEEEEEGDPMSKTQPLSEEEGKEEESTGGLPASRESASEPSRESSASEGDLDAPPKSEEGPIDDGPAPESIHAIAGSPEASEGRLKPEDEEKGSTTESDLDPESRPLDAHGFGAEGSERQRGNAAEESTPEGKPTASSELESAESGGVPWEVVSAQDPPEREIELSRGLEAEEGKEEDGAQSSGASAPEAREESSRASDSSDGTREHPEAVNGPSGEERLCTAAPCGESEDPSKSCLSPTSSAVAPDFFEGGAPAKSCMVSPRERQMVGLPASSASDAVVEGQGYSSSPSLISDATGKSGEPVPSGEREDGEPAAPDGAEIAPEDEGSEEAGEVTPSVVPQGGEKSESESVDGAHSGEENEGGAKSSSAFSEMDAAPSSSDEEHPSTSPPFGTESCEAEESGESAVSHVPGVAQEGGVAEGEGSEPERAQKEPHVSSEADGRRSRSSSSSSSASGAGAPAQTDEADAAEASGEPLTAPESFEGDTSDGVPGSFETETSGAAPDSFEVDSSSLFGPSEGAVPALSPESQELIGAQSFSEDEPMNLVSHLPSESEASLALAALAADSDVSGASGRPPRPHGPPGAGSEESLEGSADASSSSFPRRSPVRLSASLEPSISDYESFTHTTSLHQGLIDTHSRHGSPQRVAVTRPRRVLLEFLPDRAVSFSVLVVRDETIVQD